MGKPKVPRHSTTPIEKLDILHPISREIIKEYLDYKILYQAAGDKVYEFYPIHLRIFCEFIEANYNNANILEVTPSMIAQYYKSLANTRYATSQYKMAILKNFYNWCVLQDVQKLEANPFPKIAIRSPGRNAVVYIPDTKTIFDIRTKCKRLPIENAAALELLLSTGMRISEMTQLRFCDLNWGDYPNDYERKEASPFIAGSIKLYRSLGLKLKSKERTVYFSKIAGNLIRIYCRHIGVADLSSTYPIFPIRGHDGYNVIADISKYIHIETLTEQNKKTEGTQEFNFTKIDVSKLKASDDYKKKILELQASERQKIKNDSTYKQLMRLEKAKKHTFHPHCLRHAFAVFMYYRTWSGSRRDILAVKELMGHSDSRQTEKYIGYSNLCKTDMEWKRLWIGNGFEYLNSIRNAK